MGDSLMSSECWFEVRAGNTFGTRAFPKEASLGSTSNGHYLCN